LDAEHVMELQNKIVGIAGRKGSGKSRKFRELMQRSPRLVAFDTMGEHSWIPNRFRDLNDLSEFLAWASTQRTCAGSLIPEAGLDGDFAVLCEWLYEDGNFTLGIEEVPMLCQPSYLPPEFDRIVRLGRHRRVNLVWTAQRMAEVARRLTAATDLFLLFAHSEPRDLDAIAERCGREVAEHVAGLPLHGLLGM
jgi:hypothetical protein